MVLGVRSKRDEEGFLRRTASRTYYKVMRWMTSVEIPPNAGDFRLIDRKIIDVINKMPERHRFMKGIFAWPGFKVASIEFQANVRANETPVELELLQAVAVRARRAVLVLDRAAQDVDLRRAAQRARRVRLPRGHADPEAVLRDRRRRATRRC